jgi:Holliday junction DNA helicase RuvA
MIVQLTGTLVEVTPSQVVLDVQGVGYLLGVSGNTAATLPQVGTEHVTLLTRMAVRDDGVTLFGFGTREERALFDRLVAISSVGPKVALSVLSTYTPQQLYEVVTAEDATLMARVPGVGKKMASRIILELKGVFTKDPQLFGIISPDLFTPDQRGVSAQAPASGLDDDVTTALLSMGFTPREVELALQGREEAGATSLEAAVAYALKRLGNG